jgi:hypothetical protein
MAFDSYIGSQYCCYDYQWTGYPGPYGTTNTGVFTKEDGDRWDESSPHRVIGITTSLEGNAYTAAQATVVTRLYLPPDAKYLNMQPVSGPAGITGYEETYFSQLLANTLPVADFINQTGKAVRPGQIFIYLDETGNAGASGTYTTISLGTNEGWVLQPY